MEELIKAGCNLNYQDNQGNTALHGAVSTANLKSFSFLIDHHANIALKNSYGDTPLEEARFLAKKGKIPQDFVRDIEDIINRRHSNKGSKDYSRFELSDFIKAAGAGDLDYVRKAVAGGMNPDGTCNGVTALSQAAFFGRLEVMEFLISQGADVNSQNQMKRRTALHSAIDGSKVSSFKFLLEHGADPTLKNIFECDPFDEMKRNKEFTRQQIEDLRQYSTKRYLEVKAEMQSRKARNMPTLASYDSADHNNNNSNNINHHNPDDNNENKKTDFAQPESSQTQKKLKVELED